MLPLLSSSSCRWCSFLVVVAVVELKLRRRDLGGDPSSLWLLVAARFFWAREEEAELLAGGVSSLSVSTSADDFLLVLVSWVEVLVSVVVGRGVKRAANVATAAGVILVLLCLVLLLLCLLAFRSSATAFSLAACMQPLTYSSCWKYLSKAWKNSLCTGWSDASCFCRAL